eukprot:1700860-Amphidinium_carterae.1
MDATNVERKERLHKKVLSLLEQKEKADIAKSSTFTFSSAAICNKDLLGYEENVQTLEGNGALLKKKRDLEMAPTAAVSELQWLETRNLHVLSSDDTRVGRDSASVVLHRVSACRDAFQNAVFVVRDATSARNYYRFLFASQRPAFAYFLKCHVSTLQGMQQEGDILADEFTREDIFKGRESADIDVIMQSSFVEGHSLEAYHDAYCLSDILLSLPSPSRQHEIHTRTGGAQSSGTTSAAHTSPWLAQLQQHVSSTSSKSSVNVTSVTEEVSTLSDEDGDEHASPFMLKLEEFDRQRQEDVVPPWPEHFTTHLLGGSWQVQRTGREVYGYRVDAKKTSFVF